VSAPPRIIVGVDGSEASLRAVTWAAELAGWTGGEIVAVHVVGLLTHLADDSVAPSAEHSGEVAAQLEQWCRPLADAHVAYRSVLIDGDPVSSLLRAARDEDADLVVVGARGTGGYPGLVLGSTSQQLVHQADRPVTVVPDAHRSP
jgi:nucleotide-binding universal stress UspA family protein